MVSHNRWPTVDIIRHCAQLTIAEVREIEMDTQALLFIVYIVIAPLYPILSGLIVFSNNLPTFFLSLSLRPDNYCHEKADKYSPA
jgi:hypothetical protein